MRRCLLSVLLLLCWVVWNGAYSAPMSASSPGVQVWMAPNTAPDFDRLFDPGAPWDTVKEGVDVFKFYIGTVNNRFGEPVSSARPSRKSSQDPASAAQAVEALGAANVAIAVEAGGLRGFQCSGEKMARIELDKIAPLLAAGGSLRFLDLDSPFGHTLATAKPNACNYTVTQAAEQLLAYMQKVHERLPNVSIGLIEPVPWYTVGRFPHNPGNNFGDLPQLLDTVLGVLQRGGETLDFFHADSPFDFNEALRSGQGWDKLVALQTVVHDLGMRFGLIYNSDRAGHTSDELYYQETMAALQKFQQAGGAPDDFIVQSWYPRPSTVLPEDQPFTFTYLVGQFLEQLR